MVASPSQLVKEPRMRETRFAIFGTGFWSRFQLAGWQEIPNVRCVAVYNRTRSKGQAYADAHGIPAVYDDATKLLDEQEIDFCDVITAVETHASFVKLCCEHGVRVISQKPMATSLAEAESMVAGCQAAGVPFYVHENWRWQPQIRAFKAALDAEQIGAPFRARVHYNSSFPVFENQPFLKELEQFILTDMGSHILDVVRFLFGEVESLYCQTHRVHADIRGEDVATLLMRMANGMVVEAEISYASRTEHERFPEAFILVEGSKGSLELAPDLWLRETTSAGTWSRRLEAPIYPRGDPAYGVIWPSIVAENRDLLADIRGEGQAETTGVDNLRTVRLVFAAYESAAHNQVIRPYRDI